MRTRTLLSLTMAALLGLVPFKASYAADAQTENLKAEIKTLNDRVSQLEKQLAGQAMIPSTQPTRSPVAPEAWDPFFDQMRAQMSQLFQDSFDRSFGPGHVNLTGPRTDIKQTPTQYILTMDLPGMDKNNINVEVKNGMLMVSGDRNTQKEVQGNQFYRQERSFGQFSRALRLPDDAKADDLRADYKNGVLEIKIGRVSSGKPGDAGGKRIQVD
jgi:HSP20 family protein